MCLGHLNAHRDVHIKAKFSHTGTGTGDQRSVETLC